MDVYLEAGARRVFACAVDWPGWARAGKTEDAALEALAAYAPRFAAVAEVAGHALPARATARMTVVERVRGNATTDFGALGVVPDVDRTPLTATQATRLAAFYAAACDLLNDVAAHAPAELRKGPRGGGRDRDAVVRHVLAAEQSYARTLGLKLNEPAMADHAAVVVFRDAVREALASARSAEPPTPKGWPPRYAARRIVWHVLDHAWEIQDRAD